MKTVYNLNSESDRKIIISNFLASKPREVNYEVQYLQFVGYYDNIEVDGIEPSVLKKLTDEQIEIIRQVNEKCKKEELNFWEVIEEEGADKYEFLQTKSCDIHTSLVPNGVDLDNPHYMYKFKIAIFADNLEDQPKVHEFSIDLTDDEYAKLLDWQLCNWYSGFNFLRNREPELFQKMSNRIENGFTPDWCPTMLAPTYAIEMTEVKADARAIFEQYGEK